MGCLHDTIGIGCASTKTWMQRDQSSHQSVCEGTLCDFLNVGANLISSRTNQKLFTFVQYYFRQCHSGQAEENFGQLTIFLVRFVPNKSFDNIKLVGNALWAWALAFTFFMSFEGFSYWFIYPNRGRIFLRENSNCLKVWHKTFQCKYV